tara:strand:+ start:813 stop:2069 length:1257 start_codon:yes stop_codon:yes gene_type:complete
MINNFNIEIFYKYLLITLAFLMPLTVFGANLIIVVIVLAWIFSGKYQLKFQQILKSKLLIASIIFFGIHVLGLVWTDDIRWGLNIVHKMWYFLLLLPVLFSIMKKEYIRHIIFAFLIAIAITEVLSYLVWFEFLPPFKNATVENPTPFMSHVSYNPILAFAIYLVCHEVFFNKNLGKLKFSFYSFFVISMSFNMFITGGRAGQVMFFAAIAILIFQFFNAEKIKSLIATIILIPGIFFVAYNSSDLFEKRVDSALFDIIQYEGVNLEKFNNYFYKDAIYLLANINTPVGERISYAIYSWKIFKTSPLIGVGTGDFPVEYKKINEVYSPLMVTTNHPHNMYSLVMVQTGLLGLVSLLAIFYYQIKQSFKSPSRFIRDVGIALPLMFLLIMLSDSYLLGHYTTLMFVLFSSFLYKDFEKN